MFLMAVPRGRKVVALILAVRYVAELSERGSCLRESENPRVYAQNGLWRPSFGVVRFRFSRLCSRDLANPIYWAP